MNAKVAMPLASIADPAGSGLHPDLFKVELALDRAKGLVVDLAPIAQLDDGGPLGGDDAALDLLVLDPLLAALRGLGWVLGREVLGPVPEARLEPVEQRLVGGPVGPTPRDLVEARLVGRGAGDGPLVTVELDAVPSG